MARRLLALVMLLVLAGCASSTPYLQMGSGADSLSACSMAVLPLVNKSEYPQGGELVGRLLASRLVQDGPGRLALAGDVQTIYGQLHIRPGTTPSPEQLRIIADRLGVDALVGGEVLEMAEKSSQGQVHSQLTLQLRLYRGVDGSQAFATYHRRQGDEYRTLMHFGVVNSISALSERVIEEVIELWMAKELINCRG